MTTFKVATAPTVYGIETQELVLALKVVKLQQHLPFTVLKLTQLMSNIVNFSIVATAPTVYGIETGELWSIGHIYIKLQQHLPFTVCAAECEAAEEQSDDEAHTLQVPEQSEGKTKVFRK